MKKRLRKKRYIGEYAMYGVSLLMRISHDLTADKRNAFLDDFIEGPIEAQNLQSGGGGSHDWHCVIENVNRRRSVSEEAIGNLKDWLGNRSELISFEVSDLWDLCYGSDPLAKNVAEQVAAPDR